jgi:type IX secretion system PorP/SprF family membrane protein
MGRILMLIMLWLLCSRLTSTAQDPVFAQAYMAPIYLNPAATGAGDYNVRVSAIHRRQWVKEPSYFNYTAISFDKYLPDVKGAYGVLVTNSNEGYLRKSAVYGTGSYTICSNIPSVADNEEFPTWIATGGLQMGLIQRRVDYSRLTFADEIDENGYIPGAGSAADRLIFNKKLVFDVSAGFYFCRILSAKGRLVIGGSAHHLNTPDESLTSSSSEFRSELPLRLSGNVMYERRNREDGFSFRVAMMVFHQQSHNTWRVGGDITPHKYRASLGVWAHVSKDRRVSGIPSDFNAFTVSVTIDIGSVGQVITGTASKVKVGIAHEFPVRNNQFSYTGGSSELGVIWDYNSTRFKTEMCKPNISTTCPVVEKD